MPFKRRHPYILHTFCICLRLFFFVCCGCCSSLRAFEASAACGGAAAAPPAPASTGAAAALPVTASTTIRARALQRNSCFIGATPDAMLLGCTVPVSETALGDAWMKRHRSY